MWSQLEQARGARPQKHQELSAGKVRSNRAVRLAFRNDLHAIVGNVVHCRLVGGKERVGVIDWVIHPFRHHREAKYFSILTREPDAACDARADHFEPGAGFERLASELHHALVSLRSSCRSNEKELVLRAELASELIQSDGRSARDVFECR